MPPNDLGDVFEAGETLVAFHLEIVGYGIHHFGRNDRFDHVLVSVQAAQLGPAGQLISHQQHQCLVAVQQHVFAVFIRQRHADTVRIGIGSQHQIRLHLLRQVDSHRHRLALLRIGRFHRREITVDHRLLGNHLHVGKAEALERLGNQPHAGTVHGRIDDLHVVETFHALGRKRQLVYFIKV